MPAEHVSVRHGPVGAAGERHPRSKERRRAVSPAEPFRTERGGHAVPAVEEEAGLRGDGDLRGGQPVKLLRPGHRGVFDPVGHGPRAVFRGAVGDDVDREIDGAVTDGVGSDGPARRIGGLDFRPELVRFGLEIAGVAGVVRPAVAAVVLADRSRFAQQGAVQEHLRRAQRQEFAAKAAGDAQVQAGSCRVRRVLAAQGVQHVKDGHQLRPGMEPARRRCPLVGGQLHRAVADPAAADPRLGKTRDAFRGVVAGGPVQRGFDGLGRVRQDQLLDQLLGRFLDQPGGPAGGVADYHAAVGVRERRLFGVGQPERGGVDDGHVAGVVPHEQRPVSRDPVQDGDVREFAAVLLLAEAGGQKPARRRRRLCRVPARGAVCRHAGLQQRVELVQSARGGDVQFAEAKPEPGGVAVRVDEAGSHGGAGEVQDLGRVQPVQVIVEAHNPALPDPQRGGMRAALVHGDDVRVAQQQIEFHGIPSVVLSGGRW